MKRAIACGGLAVGGLALCVASLQATPPNGLDATTRFNSKRLDTMIDAAREIPDSAVIRLKIAQTLRDEGRVAEADRWIEEARAIDPALVEEILNPISQRGVSDCNPPTNGPDVIVGTLVGVSHYTSGGAVGGIRAYSVGTTSCNIGNQNVLWDDESGDGSPSNRHPVIAQNLFRLKSGRFEQVGQSWLKHGFTALTGSVCCSCSGSGGNVLGVGCSDPYDAGLNGSYSWLGPKHEVNPHTAAYPHPYGSFSNNSPIGKRLQVRDTDLDPALNTGARYFMEGHYIAVGEATFGTGTNDNNNASYRECTVAASRSITLISSTQRTRPAIQAWQDVDPGVTVVNADVPSEGRFILAYKVTDNGDGTWHYEFAVHNLNSDRAGQAFSIPIPDGVNVTNIGFHDCDWHSGAPYSTTDWTSSLSGGALTWATQTQTENANANALRWATLYNFRFDADQPPTRADVTLALFKAGSPNSISITASGPEAPPVTPCPGDFDGDGQVGSGDLGLLLGGWGCSSACLTDLDLDGDVDSSDLALLLGLWGACP